MCIQQISVPANLSGGERGTSFPSYSTPGCSVTVTHWLIEFQADGRTDGRSGGKGKFAFQTETDHRSGPDRRDRQISWDRLLCRFARAHNKKKPVFLLREANKRGKADGVLDEGHPRAGLSVGRAVGVNPKGFTGVCKTGFSQVQGPPTDNELSR